MAVKNGILGAVYNQNFSFSRSAMYIAIVLVTALITALWGWGKGFFQLVMRLAALLLAYAFTWQETPAFAAYIAERGWLSGLLVWPVAGLLLFFGGSVVFSLMARGLVHLAPEHWRGDGKVAGALSGVVLGCGLGLLLVWTVGVLQDAWQLQMVQHPVASKEPALQESALDHTDRMVRDLSGDAMASVAQRAMGKGTAAQAAAQWVRRPLSMSEDLKHLASKPELRALFEDPASYAVLVRGSSADILRLPPFQALTDDPRVMQLLAAVGLSGEALPQQSQALADMLSRYARNFEKLRSTPEFQALAQDPGLREKLQQGNLLALLTDDKMRRLADMLVQGRLPDQLPAATTLQQHARQMGEDGGRLPAASTREEVSAKPLYRWRDAKGRVHITEDKPPEGVTADVIQP